MKSGMAPPRRSFIETVKNGPEHVDDAVKQYFENCVPDKDYEASGISVLGGEGVRQENGEAASPGCYIAPHGYFVIGVSVGGNGVCVDSHSGSVYWADHSNFSSSFISYTDTDTGELRSLSEYSRANVALGLKKLSDSLEGFLDLLIADELSEELDRLD